MVPLGLVTASAALGTAVGIAGVPALSLFYGKTD